MALALIVLFFFAYVLMGELTIRMGTRLLSGKGALPTTTFWESGFLWPILLPMLIYVWLESIFLALSNWPHGPESHS